MKKETEIRMAILSLLNQLEVPDRIKIIESIGKRLRQANSIQTAKEVGEFARKRGTAKKIDHLPINGELKNG